MDAVRRADTRRYSLFLAGEDDLSALEEQIAFLFESKNASLKQDITSLATANDDLSRQLTDLTSGETPLQRAKAHNADLQSDTAKFEKHISDLHECAAARRPPPAARRPPPPRTPPLLSTPHAQPPSPVTCVSCLYCADASLAAPRLAGTAPRCRTDWRPSKRRPLSGRRSSRRCCRR